MDKVPLNNSPDLTMEEITKLLFNNKFMSDIQFHVGGKVMYAHSWEIMKRSIVFWKQFRTNVSENKLIPIDDVSYDAFYAFLKFIYTDELEIEEQLICDMLKLAVRYKIVKLETQLLNTDYENIDTRLKLLEFGVLNKYELCTTHVIDLIRRDIRRYDIKNFTFVNMDATVLETFLKSDIGYLNLKESDLCDALVRWMNNSCVKNQIPFGERRTHFDKFIRFIRFPVMTANDFHLSLRKHHDLLTNDDIGSIIRRSVENCTWNDLPRTKYQLPLVYKKLCYERKWLLTKFRVLNDLILKSVRYGTFEVPDHQINISSTNLITSVRDTVQFSNHSNSSLTATCFGDSIRLKPNFEYSIEMMFLPSNHNQKYFIVSCRNENVNAIVTGPSHLVKFIDIGKYLFEIIVESPSD